MDCVHPAMRTVWVLTAILTSGLLQLPSQEVHKSRPAPLQDRWLQSNPEINIDWGQTTSCAVSPMSALTSASLEYKLASDGSLLVETVEQAGPHACRSDSFLFTSPLGENHSLVLSQNPAHRFSAQWQGGVDDEFDISQHDVAFLANTFSERSGPNFYQVRASEFDVWRCRGGAMPQHLLYFDHSANFEHDVTVPEMLGKVIRFAIFNSGRALILSQRGIDDLHFVLLDPDGSIEKDLGIPSNIPDLMRGRWVHTGDDVALITEEVVVDVRDDGSMTTLRLPLPSGEVLMQTIPTDQQGYAYVEVGHPMQNDIGNLSVASDALLLVDLKSGSVLGRIMHLEKSLIGPTTIHGDSVITLGAYSQHPTCKVGEFRAR